MFTRQTYVYLVVFLIRGISASSQPLKQLNYTSYNVNEGLLHSQVIDMVQDENGFFWISSGNGLQKFDGRNFYSISTTNKIGIEDNNYIRLFKQQNGKLWLLHKEGLSEYNMHTDKFRPIFQSKEFNSQKRAYPILETDDAIWWQVDHKNFYRQDKKGFQLTDSILFPTQNFIRSISYSNNLDEPGTIISFSDNEIFAVELLTGSYKSFSCTRQQQKFIGIENYKPDTIIIATSRGLEKLNIRNGVSSFITSYKSIIPSIATNLNIKLLALSNGNYLISEGKELFELDVSQRRYVAQFVDLKNQNFLSVGLLTKFFYDHHGNIWLITENDGIRKLNIAHAGFKYSGTNDKSKNFIRTIYTDKKENLVLCGTVDGGLHLFDTSGRLIESVNDFPGFLPPYTVVAVQKISSRKYLIFLGGGWKTYLLDSKDFSLKAASIDILKSKLKFVFDYHMNVYPLNNSQYIIQNSHQVLKARLNSSATLQFEELAYLPVPTISSHIDAQGRLWVGGRSQYFLFQNYNSSYTTFDLPEKILVRSFCNNNSHAIWMGTERGLYQLDQQGNIKKRFLKPDGLIDENIYSVLEDKKGNVWFSHNKGISCMKKDGTFSHYNKDDGLQENEFNTGAVTEAYDGEFYFGGVNGISSFFPETILQQYDRPSLFITSICIKEEEWISDTAAWRINHIRLPWKSNSLSVQFTAMGLRKPDQYTYQYRIKEVDKTWINIGNSGIAKFVLSPGKYTLQFFAGNGFTMNAEPMKEITLHIKPPYWKTGWFIGLVVVFLVSMIILSTRYIARMKLKKRIEELERKKALEEERLRISREMHDDIGAGLTRITMMTEDAKGKSQNEEQLNKIVETSRQLVSDMSEIIWSMNPEHNTLDQLLAYLREQLRNLLEYSGIYYKIDFPENGKEIVLNNAQRRNLLLIIKEIVHNVVKHSNAKQVAITIIQKKSSLDFAVKDDGYGFDINSFSNGNGLRNIKKRMEELKGKLNIQSSHSGTEVTGTVPI